jgi:hypothetical protein
LNDKILRVILQNYLGYKKKTYGKRLSMWEAQLTAVDGEHFRNPFTLLFEAQEP